MPAPHIREVDFGNARMEAYYWQDEGFAEMVVSCSLPPVAKRARVLEAHGYAEWVPRPIWGYLGACAGNGNEVFCLATSDPAKVPAATVLAIRSVVEEMEPGWVAAVAEALRYADDPRVMAAWCEIPVQAVVACLEVLCEQDGARGRPGGAS